MAVLSPAKKEVSRKPLKWEAPKVKSQVEKHTARIDKKAAAIKAHIEHKKKAKEAEAAEQKVRVTKKAPKLDLPPVEEVQYPPVVMTPQQPPDVERPGPYCQVLCSGSIEVMVPTGKFEEHEEEVTDKKTGKVSVVKRKKTIMKKVAKDTFVPIWVRVIQGNERNGVGLVHLSPSHVTVKGLAKGTKIRFAGGTAETKAKFIESVVTH
jgi:hypothetical protein